MRLAAACVCALCVPAGWGQGEAAEQDGFTSATVPASNEAMLLISRVEQAIEQADWRLALALRERLVRLSGELVPVPPGRTYYPVWRRAAELLDRLPAEGRELYRQLYDAELSARLREATTTGDVAGLRDLFRTYRGASAWPAVGAELVAQLLDRGRFGEAIETIQILAAADVPLAPAQRAQLAVALARLGRWHAADAAVTVLEQDQALQGQPGWQQRLAALRQWISAERDRLMDAAQALDCGPALAVGARWQAPLEPAGPPGLYDEDATVADAVGFLRRLPLHRPVVDGDTLVVRMRGTIWAYDALTLTLRWRVRERQRGDYAGKNDAWPAALFAGPAPDRDAEDSLSLDAHLLLSHALRHSVSTGFGLVLTIEDLAVPASGTAAAGGRGWGDSEAVSASNELVARELLTGRLAWRRGHEPTDPLFSAAFQDCPVVVGEHLCVPFVRGDELSLGLLDPATGRTVRTVQVVGPPTFFSSQGGRCLLASDEVNFYVCTGNGVVAALSRGDLSWCWATTYPSTLADRRSAVWWAPRAELREYGVDRPVVAGDLLVLAPIDCPFIFALDRFSGRELWRREREAYSYLVGAVPAGVVLGGDGVACLDAADGRTLRWRSVPLQVTGRSEVSGQHVFVPTRDGIVVLDGRTGKVLIEPAHLAARSLADAQRDPLGASHSGYRPAGHGPRDLATANVVPAASALFAVSPNSVVKYADLAATRRWCAALRARDAASARAQLADVWLDVLTGDYGQALASL